MYMCENVIIWHSPFCRAVDSTVHRIFWHLIAGKCPAAETYLVQVLLGLDNLGGRRGTCCLFELNVGSVWGTVYGIIYLNLLSKCMGIAVQLHILLVLI